MNILEKIEKLLINPDFPSKELIDYKVDNIVNSMIDKYIFNDSNNPSNIRDQIYEALISINLPISVGNNKLQFYCRNKDFDKLFEAVNLSLSRYSPYVGISTKSRPLDQKEHEKDTSEDIICSFGFCLEIVISAEMKKVFLLNKKVEEKMPDKIYKENPKNKL